MSARTIRGRDGDRIGGRAQHAPHYSIRTLEGIRFTMLFTRVRSQSVPVRSSAPGCSGAGSATSASAHVRRSGVPRRSRWRRPAPPAC
jgi:hypothetical protein